MVKEKIALLAVFVNLFLFIFKLIVGILSRSTAVLAEAINSGSDIFASGINFYGIKATKKPVDKEHPYGHYRHEVLMGLFVTIIIFLSALYIIYRAILGFFNPEMLSYNILALIVMLASAITNEVMARIKIHYGKKENSIALLADGAHSRIDVLSSVSVFLGLVLSRFWIYFDPLLAFVVGLWVLKESIALGKEATDNLLDVSVGEEKESKIKKIVKNQKIKLYDLKTQKRGSKFTANLTIVLPNNLTVKKAANIMKKLRSELLAQLNDLAYISISIKDSRRSSMSYQQYGQKFGWQLKGSKSTEETCICPKCEYEEEHIKGIPCKTRKCPKCNLPLVRSNK